MIQPKLTKIEPIKPHFLRLYYETGEIKIFDVLPYIDGSWYGELKDAAYFDTVRLLPGGAGIAWANGQDIAPHELYENSVMDTERREIMDFTKIDQLAERLRSMRPLNETELKRLQEEFMIENTYHSNAIEGNTLTLRETALILQEGITIAEKPIREHLEVIGHKDAFLYVVELADRAEPLTERTIKDIHSLVLMNDAANRGVYRRVPVRILGAEHTPPQPYLVPVEMERLIAEYEPMKQDRHILEAIGLFHLLFEGVHPFTDGNGRTGRLILNLELIKAGLLPINIKFADRKRYYECFDKYYTNRNAEPMIQLIAEYEETELKNRVALLEYCQ